MSSVAIISVAQMYYINLLYVPTGFELCSKERFEYKALLINLRVCNTVLNSFLLNIHFVRTISTYEHISVRTGFRPHDCT